MGLLKTTWQHTRRSPYQTFAAVLIITQTFFVISIFSFIISQKKHEIEIMKLIGATNWYIRWPFVLEGIFYGILGALVGWSLASGALWYFTPFLATFLKGIPVLPISILNLLQLLGIEVLLAILLGVIASFLAVLRYLK